jgi:hypothetical protein
LKSHVLLLGSIIVPLILATASCKKTSDAPASKVSAGPSGGLQGEGRWTPYGSEQGGKGSCGQFAAIEPDSKKWVALSEKFLMEQLAFKGCDVDPSGQKPPQCSQIMSTSGQSLCGTRLQIRCEDRSGRGLCASTDWFEGVLVDVCPGDRGHHDHADPGSKGDTGCRDKYIVDMDQSIQPLMTSRFDNPELIISLGGGAAPSSTPGNSADPAAFPGFAPGDSAAPLPQGPQAGGSCSDTAPDGNYSCAQQKEWGKCGDAFMQGYCNMSCGRCGAQGAAQPTPSGTSCAGGMVDAGYGCQPGSDWGSDWAGGVPSGDPGASSGPFGPAPQSSAACDDTPPDGAYTCTQQKEWGKCGEAFMQGYCKMSCGRC